MMRRSSPPRRPSDHGFGSRGERRDIPHKREGDRNAAERVHGIDVRNERGRDREVSSQRDRESRDPSRTGEMNRPLPAEKEKPKEAAGAPQEPAHALLESPGSAGKDGKSDNSHEKAPKIKKFTNRCRLFVGNLPNGTTDNELRDLFLQYGEVSEVYIQPSRNFGFVRMVSARSLSRCIHVCLCLCVRMCVSKEINA